MKKVYLQRECMLWPMEFFVAHFVFFEDDTVSINVGCIVVCETFASWPVSLFTLCLFM